MYTLLYCWTSFKAWYFVKALQCTKKISRRRLDASLRWVIHHSMNPRGFFLPPCGYSVGNLFHKLTMHLKMLQHPKTQSCYINELFVKNKIQKTKKEAQVDVLRRITWIWLFVPPKRLLFSRWHSNQCRLWVLELTDRILKSQHKARSMENLWCSICFVNGWQWRSICIMYCRLLSEIQQIQRCVSLGAAGWLHGFKESNKGTKQHTRKHAIFQSCQHFL